MIRSVLSVEPKGGDHRAIVEFFRRSRIFERAAGIDGFLGGEIHVARDAAGSVLVTALWRNGEAYERWLASTERSESAGELAALVDGDFDSASRGCLYDVVLMHPPRR